MLNRSHFIHTHIEPLAAIIKTHNCDFGFILKGSYFKFKNWSSVGCGCFWKDDDRIKFFGIRIVWDNLILYFLKCGISILWAFSVKKNTLNILGNLAKDKYFLHLCLRNKRNRKKFNAMVSNIEPTDMVWNDDWRFYHTDWLVLDYFINSS